MDRSLVIHDGIDWLLQSTAMQRWSTAAGNTGAAQQQEEQMRPPVGMPAPIAALQLVAGLEGAGRPAPFWSPMSLTQLQVGVWLVAGLLCLLPVLLSILPGTKHDFLLYACLLACLLAPSHLQSLHLQAPVSSPSEPAVFDSAAVRDLGQLTQLSLGSFAGAQHRWQPACPA